MKNVTVCVHLDIPQKDSVSVKSVCVVTVERKRSWKSDAKTAASYKFFNHYQHAMFQYMKVEEVEE